ncbi:TetR/AcrR family transcriptional regulator [Frankia sp. AgPm24]|uniref:TetR/AcrR family transcriptional regulator n=1 Tax=Frankia sp. AgPm24 TaxID=631128 RepID=UPI00200CD8FA|nr:TetR/AcrR family transcriptional regulator [Frankia sp. AgPm24]MCK9921579.1 TetR/AcrR family transcriptional regulator [Frankia sp. AgPm24]
MSAPQRATPEAAPARADVRRNRRRLLDAARAAFTEGGVDAPPAEIARRAGVGVGTLYRHFPDRASLVDAVLGDRYDTLRDEADRLLDACAASGAFAALTTWLDLFACHLALFQGMADSLRPTLLEPAVDAARGCDAMLAAWDRLFTRAQQTGAIRRDARPRDILRAVNALRWATQGTPTATDEADRLRALLLDGLRYQHTDGIRAGR